ncbi:MAG: putative ABC transporter permease [Lachnospiraceae bacterium]|nr:putative ABC transporter permease [Lachnospiraceae bacterium]
MWTKEVFGTDVYHLTAAFIIFSMLGWLVESIYMSFCNKKLTNRGFGKGPFCPIYGFGGVIGYLILKPLSGHYIQLYVAGALLATAFEYMVGRLMLKVFGEVWWDYNEKPFNYRGIICLESTVAWGFYAVIIIMFLHNRIIEFIDRYDTGRGVLLCKLVLCIATVDYLIRFFIIFKENLLEYKEKIADKYQSFRTRWY